MGEFSRPSDIFVCAGSRAEELLQALLQLSAESRKSLRGAEAQEATAVRTTPAVAVRATSRRTAEVVFQSNSISITGSGRSARVQARCEVRGEMSSANSRKRHRPPAPVFANFAVFIMPPEVRVPGANFLKNPTGPIQKHSGEIATWDMLRSAVFSSGCPPKGKAFGSRDRKEVVVIHPANEREEAVKRIQEQLGLSSLVCPRCKKCHLASTPAKETFVPFVKQSVEKEQAQIEHLVDLDEEVISIDSGDEDEVSTMSTRRSPACCPSAPSPSLSMMTSWKQLDGKDDGPDCSTMEHTPAARRDCAPVVLPGIQCADNAQCVKHLQLLSFLTRLDDKMHPNGHDQRKKAKYRSKAFKEACNVIKRLPGCIKIQNIRGASTIVVGDAVCQKIMHIGPSTIQEIEELQSSGTTKRIDDLKKKTQGFEIIKQLMLVQSIGMSGAISLYKDHQIRSWGDFLKRVSNIASGNDVALETGGKKFTFANFRATLLSLQHFESLHECHGGEMWKERAITREQVESVRELVSMCATSTCPTQVLQVVAAGSYRRGLACTTDIDLVVQGLDGAGSRGALAKIIQELKQKGRLMHMQEPRDWGKASDKHSYFTERYMGLVCIQGLAGTSLASQHCDKDKGWRRIDITVYEKKCFVYGLFHWTGGVQLNREMSKRALSKGWVMNEYGIFHNTGTSVENLDGEKVVGSPVNGCFDVGDDDGGIFALLSMQYLELHERNAGSHLVKWREESGSNRNEDARSASQSMSSDDAWDASD